MNVLIVEDERIILESIVESVLAYGSATRCKGCENPLTAIELATAERFDAALLDIHLPAMNGFELGRLLREKNPGMKIVMTTAYNHYAAEAFDLEVIDYLLKPIRHERLYRTLDKIVANMEEKKKTMSVAEQDSATYIQTFGRLSVYRGSDTLKWHRQKSAELFAYLLTHLGKAVGKYQLCEDIWPDVDPDKAIVNLQTAISQMRKNLSAFRRDEIKIEYADNSYRLLIGNCHLDVQEFEHAAAKCLQPGRAGVRNEADQERDLLAAYGFYHGPYLAQEGWLWSLGRQQVLEKRFIRILVSLIDMTMRTTDRLRLDAYLDRLAEVIGEESLNQNQYLQLRSFLV